MAALAMGLTAGGGILRSYGTLQEGYANASAAEYNANLAEQSAEVELARGIEIERRVRVQGRKALGDMRANYSASGVTMEGSPLEVLEESAANAELDALNVKYESESKAAMLRNEAGLERYKAKQYRRGAKIGAAAGLLGTAGDIAYKGSK
jgi:hypothetical protein